jgi:hypothetical protein
LWPLHDIHQDPPTDAAQLAAGELIQVLLDERLRIRRAYAGDFLLEAPHELERFFTARGRGDGRIG